MRVTRKVDDLGRILIPQSIRNSTGIVHGTECIITAVGNEIRIFSAEKKCIFCEKDSNFEFMKGKHICKSCLKKIKQEGENE